MKERMIKIIKRKDVAENASIATKDIQANTNQKTVNAVSRWIFEREENRGAEKGFSDDKILSWEFLPTTFEKTTG
ncbi:MAG: hypothetical protein ABIV48_13855 [Pyrinomonadaceae bacterium]